MRRNAPLALTALFLGLLLAACAPAGAPAPATPSPTAPMAVDLETVPMQLRDMEQDMLQLHAHVAAMEPEQRRQMAQLMADLMDETTQLMVLVDQAMDQATPAEREIIMSDLQRMQSTIQEMQQAMPVAALTPAPMMPDEPDMGHMAQQMDQMHEQMRTRLQEMDPAHMQTLMAHMGDLMGETAQLMVDMQPVFDRLSQEEQQALLQQTQQMQTTMQRMMEVARTTRSLGTPTSGQAQVAVSPQKLRDNTVTIDRAIVPEPGWVVIHAVQPDGSPGQVIGTATLQEGANTQVAVRLQDPPTEETELIAMLHRDTGEPQTFDFPGQDPPFLESGKPVMAQFRAQP